jgi:hypothetical protein
MIIVLVAIAITAILVLFFGAVRPDGEADDSEAGVKGGLGWLVPSTVLTFDDVDTAECAELAIRGLVVQPDRPCEIGLKEPAEIRLCLSELVDVDVTVSGADYPDQKLDESDLLCAPGDNPIRIYDKDSVLKITCNALTTCALAVAEAPD